MKRKILIFLLILSLVLVMTGCSCEHIWAEANCINPKTCTECGETEGAPLGHIWKAATCTDVKTCETCGAAEGEAKGHSWSDATCIDPKICAECHLTEGEALGHAWQDATTEAPKTCAACSATEGERIITDQRFTSAAAAPVLGKWSGEVSLDGEAMDQEDFGTFVCLIDYTFGPAGEMEMHMMPKDMNAYSALMVEYTKNNMYSSYSDGGYSKDAADMAFKATFGVTVSEYAVSYVANLDLKAMFDAMGIKGVYYVQDGNLYIGDDWDSAMKASAFRVDGNILSIEEFIVSGEAIALSRVAEE